MGIYLSMQRVRFSSPDAYDKFRTVFSDVRHHLKTKPGFIHLTWWEHPDEPGWYNEVSMWASKEAVDDWHMDTYHKHAKEWAANGAIMEDIITNFELVGTRLLRICPTCGSSRTSPTTCRRSRRPWPSPAPIAASTSRWPRRPRTARRSSRTSRRGGALSVGEVRSTRYGVRRAEEQRGQGTGECGVAGDRRVGRRLRLRNGGFGRLPSLHLADRGQRSGCLRVHRFD